MRWIHAALQDPRASARRVGVHVVVIGVHALLLLGVMQDLQTSWVKSRPRSADRRSVLQIRLILHRTPPRAPAVPSPLTPPARKRPAVDKRHPAAVRTMAVAPPTPKTDAPNPPKSTAAEPHVTGHAVADYVVGGNLFNGRNQPHPSRVHLPGSGAAIVQGLHMADPRYQGIAGVARALQGMVGAVDQRCYDVDAWRGMSMRQLVAHHLTPARVDQVAARYHCGVARRSHAQDLAEPLRNLYDVAPGN